MTILLKYDSYDIVNAKHDHAKKYRVKSWILVIRLHELIATKIPPYIT